MTPEQILAWAGEFEKAHGYTPNKDLQLVGRGKARGMSDDEAQMYALQEHLDALKYGQEFQAMNGRAPTEHDYRYRWFNGWTPEAIAKGGPDYLTDAPRPTRQQRVPQAPRTYFSTQAFRNGGYR